MGAPIRDHGPLLLQIEIYALSQRQVGTPVDRVRLPAHVGFPGIGSCLTATTRFFLRCRNLNRRSTGSTLHSVDYP